MTDPRKIALLTVVIAGLFCVISNHVFGTSVLIRSPENVFRDAALVVEAQVESVDFHDIPNSSRGYADVKLIVNDYIYGSSEKEVIIRRYGVSDEGE